MVSFLDKGSNKALQNPARRHSKALKMETNGPRDLKLGLNWSLENPPSDQRCTKKFFFQNRGLKGLHFWQSDGVPGSGGTFSALFSKIEAFLTLILDKQYKLISVITKQQL